MDESQIPPLLTLREASEILKCHPNTLRLWDKKGILKAVRFGERGDRRYKKEDILRFLQGDQK
jgi:excisionase family DNA binding protein